MSRPDTAEKRCSDTLRKGYEVSVGKNKAISRAADSGPSEPCTRFSVSSMPRSPRIVPGAASRRFVAPHSAPRPPRLPGAGGAPHDHEQGGPTRDEGHEIAEERLLTVLVIVHRGGLGGD